MPKQYAERIGFVFGNKIDRFIRKDVGDVSLLLYDVAVDIQLRCCKRPAP